MQPIPPHPPGEELSDRERQVLEAVVRTYVATAEPAGSRTVCRRFDLGVSAATVRNTMSDLEEKGYLLHPHTSAGRVPTDRAYRFFVDRMVRPPALRPELKTQLREALDPGGVSAVEELVLKASRALSLLSSELGIAVAPRLDEAILEKIDLIRVSAETLVLVASIRSGVIRTVYVDLPGAVPEDTLVALTAVLNERLAGLSLQEIRNTLPERLRDSAPDPGSEELLNIFMESTAALVEDGIGDGSQVLLGQASVLASQPEFTTGESLKGLIELTERPEVLAGALRNREHGGGLQITIGSENPVQALAGFTLVTAEYRAEGLKGVVGVMGPTRMPYEKVIAIVDYTSRLVTKILT
jgi:heat-inducible transcriptional repressor